MKVKELPKSLYQSIKLSLTPTKVFNDQKAILPIVVSLASIPSRIQIVHLTIRSLLMQEKHPEKIILWLHKDLKNEIPRKLSILCNNRFEIRYSELKSSHRKLVNTLKLYPNKTIVTCDDDMIYNKLWLTKLYDAHLQHPSVIVGNQTRCISYDDKGGLLPYKQWQTTERCHNPKSILPIGAGGTLYPPNTLHKDIFNSDLYLRLTPKADDLWFKAMSLKKGTLSIQSNNISTEPIPIFGSQKESLKKGNIMEDKNRTQWQDLADFYNLHKDIR